MSDDSYTLLDAIHEEIDLLKEIEAYHRSQDKGLIRAVVVEELHVTLSRILRRYEEGREYYLTVKGGKTKLDWRQTNRHLVRQYPAVAAAQQSLGTLESLVGNKNS